MRRVLLVHNRYRSSQPSGENDVVERESELLLAHGVDVEVLQRSSDEIESMSTSERLAVPFRSVWSRRDRLALEERIRRTNPDVVHVHNTFPLLSPSVLAACENAGVPAVATVHNYKLMCANGSLLRDGSPCLDCVGRFSVPAIIHGCYRTSRIATAPVAAGLSFHRLAGTWERRVRTFIALSAFQRQLMIEHGLPGERIVVKDNFVPDSKHRCDGGGNAVTFLGRLSEEKGIDVLLRAWELLPGGAVPGVELVIAGDGPQRSAVESLARRDAAIRYAGRLTAEECAVALASSRVVVVPSRWYETFGLVVVEAFRAGVPVIAPAHGSFPELVDPGMTGWLYRPNSAEDLAQVLRSALALPVADLRAMGAAARRTYERRFTAERNLDALLAVYEGALDARQPDATGSGERRALTA